MKFIFIFILALVVSGCSAKFEGNSIVGLSVDSKKICIIARDDIKKEFLVSYKKILEEKGFEVKVIPRGYSVDTCRITSKYAAKWSWDFVSYLSEAAISVYKDDVLIGSASYSTPQDMFSSTEKFYISTDEKVKGMVEVLFPESKKQ